MIYYINRNKHAILFNRYAPSAWILNDNKGIRRDFQRAGKICLVAENSLMCRSGVSGFLIFSIYTPGFPSLNFSKQGERTWILFLRR